MEVIVQILSSGEFWTAIGSLAALGGLWRALRGKRNQAEDSGSIANTGQNVDELDDVEEFIDSQVELINNASIAVSLCLHTVHGSSENWKAKRVNEALITAKSKGLLVRVLAGTGPEQIQGAYELAEKGGIDVRLNPELLHSDLRFLRTDADKSCTTTRGGGLL